MSKKRMPGRGLFGPRELDAVREVFERAWEQGVDFGYQGEFEQRYTQAFCEFQGGGHADAVCSGTAAVLVALAALDLEPGSEILVSPVTDPGGVAPAIMLGHGVTIADSEPGSYNVGPEQFEAALTPETRGAVVTHVGGFPARMDEIMEVARARNVRVVEDCSQAHGARYRGQRVGAFGDAAAFSTMFSKSHASGGCGGLVYTRDRDTYARIRALADRGKDFFRPDFDPRDPSQTLFAGLNLNQDEISCAIGRSTLERLPEIIEGRRRIASLLTEGLADVAGLSAHMSLPDSDPSYFFFTVRVDEEALGMTKMEYALRLKEAGIQLNPDYKFTTADWPWIAPHVTGRRETPNARGFRNCSFNLLFHERFEEEHINFILDKARAVVDG